MNMRGPYMHNSFWNEQQVAITFQLQPIEPAQLDAAMQNPSLFIGKPTFINTLNLDKFDSYLTEQGFVLDSFKLENSARIPFEHDDSRRERSSMDMMPEIPHSSKGINRTLTDETGKYLFFPKDSRGRYVPTLISFFTFTERGIRSDMNTMSTQSAMGNMSMAGQEQPSDEHGDDNGKGMPPMKSPVAKLVNLINRDAEKLRSTLNSSAITRMTASPTWQCGGTGHPVQPDGSRSQGCPLTPPMPVTEVCSTSPGLWPITLPELKHDLQNTTGDGVTVFVLDTLPKLGTIKRAAESAENDNLLLLDVMENVIPNASYQLLPDVLDVPSPHMPETGKDLYGRVVGFHMADHGLFEAGVIQDIAPDANIECIRVLNDFCVGDVSVLIQALEGIHYRVLFGNLKDKSVVINLSLVIPADSEAVQAGIDPALLDLSRKGLLDAIQALADSGVVFVASAGNEGDLRYTPMNPSGERPNALYPAAYAYNGLTQPEMMIPVGAVNSTGKAASYSCYPGALGVATYGGEVPATSDIKTVDHVTQVSKIDGMIGIYTALQYPALSVTDRIANYPVPNAHGWAYWVGTSFATPIISALAARVLEAKERGTLAANVVVQQTIIAQGATRQVSWDRLNVAANGNVDTLVGSVVWAEQKCKPTKIGSAEDADEEAEINITEIHVDEVNIIEA